MARRNASQWAELVAQWKGSGLTAKEFGARESVSPKSLTRWSWHLRSQGVVGASAQSALPAFLPVHVVERECAPKRATAADEHVDVLVDGRNTVRVLPGFDKQTLRHLLDVLHEKAAR